MVVCHLLLQADGEGPYPHLLRRLLRHTDARHPNGRGQVGLARARSTNQHHVAGCLHELARGQLPDQHAIYRRAFKLKARQIPIHRELGHMRASGSCGLRYHLVLHTRQGNLSLLMRRLNGVYTQAYNRRHGVGWTGTPIC